MQQKTHLAHGVEKTQFESEYDEKAKDLLSDKQVTGMNTESKIPNEGEITFDIRFHAISPDKEQVDRDVVSIVVKRIGC